MLGIYRTGKLQRFLPLSRFLHIIIRMIQKITIDLSTTPMPTSSLITYYIYVHELNENYSQGSIEL